MTYMLQREVTERDGDGDSVLSGSDMFPAGCVPGTNSWRNSRHKAHKVRGDSQPAHPALCTQFQASSKQRPEAGALDEDTER